MAENSKIEWCDHTFNPWVGCTKVSPACDNCYAEARNARFAGGQAINWGPGAPRRRTSASNWQLPIKWNQQAQAAGVRYRVFCASLADVFDNDVPTDWRRNLYTLIQATPHLDWLQQRKAREVEYKEIRPMLDGICVRDQSDRLIAQIHRIRGRGVSIQTDYIHSQSVDWLREAIDLKLEQEKRGVTHV
jgi:protein gp37